jgi:hypothetical protein
MSFVEGEVGDRLAEPLVLLLQLFQAAQLIRLHAPVLLAPAIVGNLSDADLPDRVRRRCALRLQHFNLPELCDDLLRLVALACHALILRVWVKTHTSRRTRSVGEDHGDQ